MTGTIHDGGSPPNPWGAPPAGPVPVQRSPEAAHGRRFHLARELTKELDWLRDCSVPRIVSDPGHVADAGWTATDIKGWLHLRGEGVWGAPWLGSARHAAGRCGDGPRSRQTGRHDRAVARSPGSRPSLPHSAGPRPYRAVRGGTQAPSSQSVQQQVNEAFTVPRSTPSPRPPHPWRRRQRVVQRHGREPSGSPPCPRVMADQAWELPAAGGTVPAQLTASIQSRTHR